MSTQFTNRQWRLPNAWNGTESNVNKQSNYSMDFDSASSDYISGNINTPSTFTNLTVSCWVNVDSFSAIQNGILSSSTSSGQHDYENGFALEVRNDNKFRFKVSSGGSTTNWLVASDTSSTNQWYHIACVVTPTQLELFVNGVSKGTESNSSLTPSFERFFIGSRFYSSSPANYFDGQLDAVSIFNYALSSSQITTLWGGGTSVSNPMALPSPPIAYYPLGTSAFNGEYLAENNAIGDYVFDFDGSNYIDLNFQSQTTPATISMWVNTDVNDSQQRYAIINGRADQQPTAYLRMQSDNTYQVFISNTNGSDTLQGSSATINTWFHFTIVCENSQTLLYENGVLKDSSTIGWNGIDIDQSNNWQLGRDSRGQRYWNGKISNVQTFNTALSASEAETLYNYGSPIRTLANIPQSSNLKAWYKLDASEIYNSTTTEWSIDNNQNPSAYASSLDFDGASSDFIQINNGSSLTNGFSELTVSIWANFSSNLSQQQIISKDDTSQRSWILRKLSSGVNFLVSTDGTSASQTLFYPNSSITIGKWYHFVGIYDGSKLLLYVDGVLIDDSVSLTGSLPSTTSGLFIGSYGFNNNTTFDGSLSNAQIFNSALPATGSNSVETLYNNGSPLTSMSGFTSLVSWWKLNNTTTGIEDSKGSNNGTNNGATEYTGFVNTLAGDSSGMSQANLVQSDLQTVAPYSKYAMNFLGTDNDYIDCGNSALTAISGGSNTLTTSMTLSTWFKLGSSSASRGLIGFGDLNNNYGGLAVRHESGVFSFLRANQHMVSGGYSFSDTTNWHNMVFVYDPNNADNCKVYIDSVNVNLSFVNVGSVSLENKKLTIGAYYGLSDTFTGELSNFSTWNTTLTSAQVTEIYNQGLPSNLNSHSAYSNLVSWWQLGENSSFTGDWIFADEKGSNNGDGQNMTEANLINGVGTTANGVSSGMSEGNLVGDAPYSTANALSTNMVITSRVSGVSDATITTGGTGYVTGTNIATTGGSGTNCTINITTVSGGVITAITINNGGSNYVIGDVLTISGGNGNATITVSGLNTP